MTVIREPAVAGQFYPGNAAELHATVTALLAEAQDKDTPAPKALIVPHRGFARTGAVIGELSLSVPATGWPFTVWH